jgi:hypothetical protein
MQSRKAARKFAQQAGNIIYFHLFFKSDPARDMATPAASDSSITEKYRLFAEEEKKKKLRLHALPLFLVPTTHSSSSMCLKKT